MFIISNNMTLFVYFSEHYFYLVVSNTAYNQPNASCK